MTDLRCLSWKKTWRTERKSIGRRSSRVYLCVCVCVCVDIAFSYPFAINRSLVSLFFVSRGFCFRTLE